MLCECVEGLGLTLELKDSVYLMEMEFMTELKKNSKGLEYFQGPKFYLPRTLVFI